jgi:anti-sigma factor RsiW
MELATGRTSDTSGTVMEHLTTCSTCAVRFEEEKKLSEALLRMEMARLPGGFVQRTLERFRKQAAPRFGRHLFWGAAVSMILAGVMVWLVVLNLPELIDKTASFISVVSSIIGAGYSVSVSYPSLANLLALAMAVVTVVCASVLAGLVKRAAVVK